MSGAWRQFAAVSGACLLAAACASTDTSEVKPAPNAGIYRVGKPYTVAGVQYVPKEEPAYEATGTASWYGPRFHGRLTADGEVFDRNKLTAAHPTLPMPTTVRVTNLENSREVVVRVNDRGPFVGSRLIDLSERAAEVLGFKEKGTAEVRVTYLGRADGKSSPIAPPPKTAPDVATAIASAEPRVQTASFLPVVSPDPAPSPKPAVVFAPGSAPVPETDIHPVVGVTSYFVQAGAYTSFDNANHVLVALKSLGASISALMKNGEALYRVRLGPFGSVGDAGAALVRVQELGHNDARIVVD